MNNTTRRQFLQYCTTSAAALCLSQIDLLKSDKALGRAGWLFLRVTAIPSKPCMRKYTPASPQTLLPVASRLPQSTALRQVTV
ncbi:MAG: twin-arginine translocation signal domain-containing protein [Desulfobacterales bacterium]|nr:twin-arginine translocation signal domain-containing protein [Desulfobacterales bacterium]